MVQLQWLWRYMGRRRAYFVWGVVIAAVTSVALIINPMLSQRLIDEVITPQDTRLLIPLLAAMLAVQVVRQTLRYVMVVLLEKNALQMTADVRRRMYDVIQNQDAAFAGRMPAGNLMTRMTNDLDMLRHALVFLAHSVVDSVALFLSVVIFLFTVNWALTLSLLAVLPFILIITRRFSRRIRPMYVTLREKLTVLGNRVRENIAANRVVKAFAREEYEKEVFEAHNEAYRKVNVDATLVATRYQPALHLLGESLTIITLLLGGFLMIRGSLTAGELLAFSSLTWALANPMRNFGTIISDIQRFYAACTMIIEIFYAQPTVVDRMGAAGPEGRLRGEVEFKNVSYEVAGKKILQDVSFHLEPGQTLGILGSTGAGKTTLVNMLTRFAEPTAGAVLLDGKGVESYTLSGLRRSVAPAMQEVFLFSDTVQANIAYGDPDLPPEEVERRAVQADADGFIRKMEDGYQTLVGERGVGISGGQKQRISLARALAMRPSVLVLDDTTSAVDMETEHYIQSQLRSLDYDCTKVIVAQRLTSLCDADLILVLEGGRVIERGTHAELMAQEGEYHALWRLQNDMGLEQEVG